MDQGLCAACCNRTPSVNGVRPTTCSQCQAPLVATEAAAYAVAEDPWKSLEHPWLDPPKIMASPWKDMTSDKTQVASSTERYVSESSSGKGAHKGSKQEASSSGAETVRPAAPTLGASGVAVEDVDSSMRSLRCTTITIVQKHEGLQ